MAYRVWFVRQIIPRCTVLNLVPLIVLNECKYMKHIFERRIKDQIEERSSQLLRNLSSCEKQAFFSQLLKLRSNCEDLSSI